MNVVFNRDFGKEEDRKAFRKSILRSLGWFIAVLYGYFCSYGSYIGGRVGHSDFLLFMVGIVLVVYSLRVFISSIDEVVRSADRVKLIDYSSFAYNGLVLTELSVGEDGLRSVENLCLYDGRVLSDKLERKIPFEKISTVLVDNDTLVIRGELEEEGYKKFLESISSKHILEPSSLTDLNEFRFSLKEGYYNGYNKDDFVQFLEDKGLEILELNAITSNN